jgi:hypothetical protein
MQAVKQESRHLLAPVPAAAAAAGCDCYLGHCCHALWLEHLLLQHLAMAGTLLLQLLDHQQLPATPLHCCLLVLSAPACAHTAAAAVDVAAAQLELGC